MSAVTFKLENGLCRCCLSEGLYKSLDSQFVIDGREAIYREVIKQCLDITLKPMTGEYSSITFTICDSCILQLRDAHNFKKQVLSCEERLREVYSTKIVQAIEPFPLKIELTEDNPEFDEYNTHVDDDDFNYPESDEDDKTLVELKLEEETSRKTKGKTKAKKSPVTLKKAKKVNKKSKSKINIVPIEEMKETKVEPAEEPKPEKSGAQKRHRKDRLTQLSDLEEYYTQEVTDDGVKAYVCNKCGIKLKRKENVQQHILILHFTLANVQCPQCSEKFNSEAEKQTHIKQVHVDNSDEEINTWEAVISDNNEDQSNSEEVESDAEINTQEARILANNTEQNESSLLFMLLNTKSHKKTTNKRLKRASNEGKYNCKDCGKPFELYTKLRRHFNNVHKLFKCSKCDLMFNRYKIRFHLHEVHGMPIPTCGVCGFKSVTDVKVIIHQRKVHMMEKNIECELCDLKFFDTVDLAKHMVKHSSDRNFECKFCRKKFQRKSTLNLHEKIHTGEKNKVCTVCNERFVQKASLTYHMTRYHPGAV